MSPFNLDKIVVSYAASSPGAATLSSFIQRATSSCGLLLEKMGWEETNTRTHTHATVSRTCLQMHAEAALKEQESLGCVCGGGGEGGGGRSAKGEKSPGRAALSGTIAPSTE